MSFCYAASARTRSDNASDPQQRENSSVTVLARPKASPQGRDRRCARVVHFATALSESALPRRVQAIRLPLGGHPGVT